MSAKCANDANDVAAKPVSADYRQKLRNLNETEMKNLLRKNLVYLCKNLKGNEVADYLNQHGAVSDVQLQKIEPMSFSIQKVFAQLKRLSVGRERALSVRPLEEFLAERTSYDFNRKLYDHMRTRPKKDLDTFIDGIIAAEQEHIAEQLADGL